MNDSVLEDPTRHFLRALATTAALTAAAEFLLYEITPGLGWGLFFLLLGVGIVANRDRLSRVGGKEIALGGMLLASALQTVVRPSFSNVLVLVLLTIYLSGHLLHRGTHPWWRRFAEGLFALGFSPLRWLQVGHWISSLEWKLSREKSAALPVRLVRLGIIVLPSLLMAGVFLVLLGKGNAVLGEAVREMQERIGKWFTGIELPGFGHVVFWSVTATLVLGLLWRARASKMVQLAEAAGKRFVRMTPSDTFTGVWATRMLLLTVNAVFFAANTIDVRYLWRETELPAGVSYSQFVHLGTANLLASVVLAAALLGVLFSQKPAVTRARGQRLLAGLWIAQNILLAANVIVRLKMYVNEYQLSLLRLHLMLFVLLVGVGFILLAVRIFRERTFGWLFGANLLAAFLLFFVVQFWNTRGFVARFNVREAAETGRRVDLSYLRELGPSAWPRLREIADAPSYSPLAGQRMDAERQLARLRAHEKSREAAAPWQAFQIHRAVMRPALEREPVSP